MHFFGGSLFFKSSSMLKDLDFLLVSGNSSIFSEKETSFLDFFDLGISSSSLSCEDSLSVISKSEESGSCGLFSSSKSDSDSIGLGALFLFDPSKSNLVLDFGPGLLDTCSSSSDRLLISSLMSTLTASLSLSSIIDSMSALTEASVEFLFPFLDSDSGLLSLMCLFLIGGVAFLLIGVLLLILGYGSSSSESLILFLFSFTLFLFVEV